MATQCRFFLFFLFLLCFSQLIGVLALAWHWDCPWATLWERGSLLLPVFCFGVFFGGGSYNIYTVHASTRLFQNTDAGVQARAHACTLHYIFSFVLLLPPNVVRSIPTDAQLLFPTHRYSAPNRGPTFSKSVSLNTESGSEVSDSDSQSGAGATRSSRGLQLRMPSGGSGRVSLWCRRTPQWFGIGSGDRVALGIDQKLLHGVTESTVAFYNPPLNGEKYHGDFKCVAVEVWGLTH